VRCYELVQGQALVKRGRNGIPSVPQSPMDVLDAACFSFKSDDATLGWSQSNTNSTNNSNEASTPASKRRRISMSPI
jgi:cyclin D1/2/4, plant